MFIVGLTGGIGCGKSEVSRLFSELGVPIVDVDVISHQLTAKGQATLQAIANQFGTDVLNKDGSLNREYLREIVFNNPEARHALEAIMHPAIYDQAMIELNRNKAIPYQILAVPLLFESTRYQKLINRSLVIDCDSATQIDRASKRDGSSKSQIEKIIAAQIPRETRNQLADDIITNNGSLDDLKEKVIQLNDKYRNTCAVTQSTS
ncbi:MAG: dephospho-CoA kinase [Pseudomonadota bacterium]